MSRIYILPVDKMLGSDQPQASREIPSLSGLSDVSIISVQYFPVKEPPWMPSDSHPPSATKTRGAAGSDDKLSPVFSIKGGRVSPSTPFERFMKLTN